jgi:hypothetical protein
MVGYSGVGCVERGFGGCSTYLEGIEGGKLLHEAFCGWRISTALAVGEEWEGVDIEVYRKR